MILKLDPMHQKTQVQEGCRHTSGLWIRKLMALGYLTSITNGLFIGLSKRDTIISKNLMNHN
jgi:hypothetical protein